MTDPAPQPACTFRLSPSDFAFLWEECQRCFYLKVVKGFRRPSSPMPKIFTNIDLQMKQCFGGKCTTQVVPALPKGVFEYSEKWVQSMPITVPGHKARCVVRGKFDNAIKFDDGTYGINDCKTSTRNEEHISVYSRQLHAYAYAVENPAPDYISLKPVSGFGLLVFEPGIFVHREATGRSGLAGDMSWIEIARDEPAFLRFLGEVLEVLEQPDIRGGSPGCKWCIYRDACRRTGL
jgi:hypothetical protein